MNFFDTTVLRHQATPLQGVDFHTVQVNIGLKCNLACAHCHVAASPHRKEMMQWETMQAVICAAERADAKLIDITGGSPEMHPLFREFVKALRERDFPVLVRTNLTVLLEPGFESMPGFFRDHGIQLVASLPCYQQANVDGQRGDGTFERCIQALRRLNSYGYGIEELLPLDLVYNPTGPTLPPDQTELEQDYKHELGTNFGIHFTRLLTITNLPIGRFMGQLKREGEASAYRRLLEEAFNPATLDGLMCRHQINIGWDGRMYDCDFNLALGLPLDDTTQQYIHGFDPSALANRQIATGPHCFGCTAGSGSSCTGALVD